MTKPVTFWYSTSMLQVFRRIHWLGSTTTWHFTSGMIHYKWIVNMDTVILLHWTILHSSRLRFTKRWNVLPPNFATSRSHEIQCYNDRVALKFDRHLGSSTADMRVKFQSDWKRLTQISRLRDFMRFSDKTSVRLVNRGPRSKVPFPGLELGDHLACKQERHRGW